MTSIGGAVRTRDGLFVGVLVDLNQFNQMAMVEVAPNIVASVPIAMLPLNNDLSYTERSGDPSEYDDTPYPESEPEVQVTQKSVYELMLEDDGIDDL